jgi:hypothetical protein
MDTKYSSIPSSHKQKKIRLSEIPFCFVVLAGPQKTAQAEEFANRSIREGTADVALLW